MLSTSVFFAFIAASNNAARRSYNEWGALTHTPANLRLPGIAWGDRWERDGDCARSGSADESLAATDFVTLYWFTPDAAAGIEEWTRLSTTTWQQGLGAAFDGITRPMAGFFTPIRGYSAPRLRLDPDVLPFRPHRGVHLSVTRYGEPSSASAHELFRRLDGERLPELVRHNGIAGAWTFLLEREFHPAEPVGTQFGTAGGLRVELVFVDGNLLEAAGEIESRHRQWDTEDSDKACAAQRLFSGPLRTIDPWQAADLARGIAGSTPR